MQRILALDTSTWWGGLALLERGGTGAPTIVVELGTTVRESHAAHLLGWIEQALATAGWSRGELDGFVATRGPGSFTGIRIALGTLRGLSLATGQPCAGVTTLDALTEAHGPAEAERVPLVVAGRGELYGARHDAAGSPPRPLEAAWLDRPQRVAGLRDVVLIPAPGSEAVVRQLGAAGRRIAAAPRSIAAAAGRLALLRDELRAPRELAPLYLRPPDAETHARS